MIRFFWYFEEIADGEGTSFSSFKELLDSLAQDPLHHRGYAFQRIGKCGHVTDTVYMLIELLKGTYSSRRRGYFQLTNSLPRPLIPLKEFLPGAEQMYMGIAREARNVQTLVSTVDRWGTRLPPSPPGSYLERIDTLSKKSHELHALLEELVTESKKLASSVPQD